MNELDDYILPVDVAVVDEDVLISTQTMNAVSAGIHGATVESFVGIVPALERLAPGRPAVVALGPTQLDKLDRYAELRTVRPELGLVAIIDNPADPPPGLVELLDAAPVDPFDNEGIVAAVNESLGMVRAAHVAAAVPHRAPLPASGQGAEPAAGGYPHLVVVTSGTGGVGATTLTLNLATGLAAAGHDTVVLDAQGALGDLQFLLGFEPQGHYEIDDLAIDPDVMAHYLQLHEPTGIKLLSPPLRGAELDDLEPLQLAELVLAVEPHCEVVVADVPAALLSESGLTAVADLVVVTVANDVASLKNGRIIAAALGRKKNLGAVVVQRGPHADLFPTGAVTNAMGIEVLGELPFDEHLELGSRLVPPEPLAPGRSRYHRVVERILDTIAEHLDGDVERRRA